MIDTDDSARIEALISPETRAAVASVIEHEIDREYGTQDAEAANGASILALAGLGLDLRSLTDEDHLRGLTEAQLRIMVRAGLAARRCQCSLVDGHGHRGRCGRHTEADVPPIDGALLCGTCYAAQDAQ